MDAKVDINFDSREKKWSGSGDTRAPVVPVAPVAAEAPVPPVTKAMAGTAQSAAPVQVSQSWKKSDKFDERKQKTRLRWTKNMTWKRFNDETGEAEYVLYDD